MPASTTIGQRFTQLIQYLGLSKNAFAQSLDKTATVIQHLVDERNKPGYDLLCKVFEVYPNVSKDWLMEGQGAMLKQGVATAPLPPATAAAPAPELDFDPIEIPALPRPSRRQGNSLQPADIAATLALAASTAPPVAPMVAPFVQAAGATPPVAEPLVTLAAPVPPTATPLPVPVPVPDPALAAPAMAVPALPPSAPDAGYLAIAFQTQHLQHQLALAEQRNQHLLEQQALMQQLVALLQK